MGPREEVKAGLVNSESIERDLSDSDDDIDAHYMSENEVAEAKQVIDQQINKFEQYKRSWLKQQLEKPKRERRKELQVWVGLLMSNLRKINGAIEQHGEDLDKLFREETKARKQFDAFKKRGMKAEEKARKEIQRAKQSYQDLIEAN